MPDERSARWELWCPVCLTSVGDESRCPRCGLSQAGPQTARLRVAVARLDELTARQATLVAETSALAGERARLLATLRGAPPLTPTLTAAAPALGTAALRRGPATGYGWSSAAATVGAVWAWLVVADVAVLEASTLPAAVVLLVTGVLRRHREPEVGSGSAYGPGLVLALGPSLVVAIARGGTVRPFAVIAGALVCVLVGSRLRLRAPLILGAVALLALAVDALGPVAAQLPRWASLGAVGVLMLWLGASAEQRMEQLRTWRHTLEQLA